MGKWVGIDDTTTLKYDNDVDIKNFTKAKDGTPLLTKKSLKMIKNCITQTQAEGD